MPAFTGQLNVNEIYGSIYNMIISQQVFADNINDTKITLADMSRVDGSMYGDTKLYYATDALASVAWTDDSEASSLLAVNRAPNPECQAITIDTFRMIPLTTDNYMSKRAWGDEFAFSQFNSQLLAWMRDTKKVYDATTFNTYVGTTVATGAKQTVEVNLPAAPSGSGATNVENEAYNRTVAQTIATEIADLIVDLEDISRDYNDYGFLRSYNLDDLVFVWNSEWVNKIKKLDLPTIFHKDIIDKFAEHTLPARYFGAVNASTGTGNGTTVRSLVEQVITGSNNATHHVFAGDLIPSSLTASNTYTVDGNIICKIYHKDSIPFMTGFETGTEFFNARSLTSNHYTIWGHNSLEYLKNYPFITVKAKYPSSSSST